MPAEFGVGVAKSTALWQTSFFMNVESWPLLGQVDVGLWPTKPQSEDNSLALPTWLSRGVERLMPPGPWDFLEALWGVWFARPKTNVVPL
ncbi:hypothetical protein VNO78_29731 [Psophocarpus tetragonolobus]|uniref:Uncharacterized protein n=1 Tax=Psophocarpus tetragonolobus TaxID=3891 RepID=A0AAN9X2P3_PSOTE